MINLDFVKKIDVCDDNFIIITEHHERSKNEQQIIKLCREYYASIDSIENKKIYIKLKKQIKNDITWIFELHDSIINTDIDKYIDILSNHIKVTKNNLIIIFTYLMDNNITEIIRLSNNFYEYIGIKLSKEKHENYYGYDIYYYILHEIENEMKENKFTDLTTTTNDKKLYKKLQYTFDIKNNVDNDNELNKLVPKNKIDYIKKLFNNNKLGLLYRYILYISEENIDYDNL